MRAKIRHAQAHRGQYTAESNSTVGRTPQTQLRGGLDIAAPQLSGTCDIAEPRLRGECDIAEHRLRGG